MGEAVDEIISVFSNPRFYILAIFTYTDIRFPVERKRCLCDGGYGVGGGEGVQNVAKGRDDTDRFI